MGFELATDIFNLRQLRETDLSTFDSFYLGNPLCSLYEGNFIADSAALKECAAILSGEGKKFYLNTPVAPRGEELKRISEILDLAKVTGAGAIEFHNMGVLYKISKEMGGFPAHAGAFANIYTQLTASFLKDYGVVRVRPNVEVSLDEMEVIKVGSLVDVTVMLHGKIPLGIVSDCFLIDEGGGSGTCPSACLDPAILEARKWKLMHVGKGVFSAKDLCMIEHLAAVGEKGFRVFRIEGGYEKADYRNGVGMVYREALSMAMDGERSILPDWKDALEQNSQHGLCNGYMFGTAGRLYINARGEEIPDAL